MENNNCQCKNCIRERKEGVMINDFFLPKEYTQMIVCSLCGNKRCPHASNHNNQCTNSNELGQEGSS